MEKRREASFEMPHIKRGRCTLVCLFAQLHIIKGKKRVAFSKSSSFQ